MWCFHSNVQPTILPRVSLSAKAFHFQQQSLFLRRFADIIKISGRNRDRNAARQSNDGTNFLLDHLKSKAIQRNLKKSTMARFLLKPITTRRMDG
jgi:hypothetical protein